MQVTGNFLGLSYQKLASRRKKFNSWRPWRLGGLDLRLDRLNEFELSVLDS
jgi:hypothetical protein